jgi:hypothetical protein
VPSKPEICMRRPAQDNVNPSDKNIAKCWQFEFFLLRKYLQFLVALLDQICMQQVQTGPMQSLSMFCNILATLQYSCHVTRILPNIDSLNFSFSGSTFSPWRPLLDQIGIQ